MQNNEKIVIELKNVAFNYIRKKGYFLREKFWALKDITFSIYRGESVGLIGRNGAGKSTLLRLIAGIVKPDKGELVNYGVTATLLSLQAGFTPYLSGRDNAILNGMMLGLNMNKVKEKLNSIKDFSELNDFFEYPVQTYSSGMKARLGFSVAFQIDPDILLVDEVHGVGDEYFKKKSSTAMRQKVQSGKTVVIVSHHQQTLRELCKSVVWIDKGEIIEIGDANSVMNAYIKYVSKNKN